MARARWGIERHADNSVHTYAFDLRQGLWHETEALEEQLLIPLLNSDLDWYALIINRMLHTALNAAGYYRHRDARSTSI